MLSRWDKVSVTAFRYGHQKKLGETITQTRKKKVKWRLAAGNRGFGVGSSTRKKISNRKAEELGRNFGSTNRIPPIFEGM
jgi:hypothetical protein